MQNLINLQQWLENVPFSEDGCSLVEQTFTDILQKPAAFNFRLGNRGSNEGCSFLLNVPKLLPDYTASRLNTVIFLRTQEVRKERDGEKMRWQDKTSKQINLKNKVRKKECEKKGVKSVNDILEPSLRRGEGKSFQMTKEHSLRSSWIS